MPKSKFFFELNRIWCSSIDIEISSSGLASPTWAKPSVEIRLSSIRCSVHVMVLGCASEFSDRTRLCGYVKLPGLFFSDPTALNLGDKLWTAHLFSSSIKYEECPSSFSDNDDLLLTSNLMQESSIDRKMSWQMSESIGRGLSTSRLYTRTVMEAGCGIGSGLRSFSTSLNSSLFCPQYFQNCSFFVNLSIFGEGFL